MDAPQISILRDDDSPPPQRKAQGSRKQKASLKKPAEFPYLPRPRKEFLSEGEFDEQEEEEDQLIDDDDDQLNQPALTQVPGRSAEVGQKRKAPSKRKPRKNDKRPDEDKKGKEKQPFLPVTTVMNIEPPGMEPPSSETIEDTNVVDPALSNVPQGTLPVIVEPGPGQKLPVPPKKKASPRKPPVVPRQRTKVSR